jgi:hypothetical protein
MIVEIGFDADQDCSRIAADAYTKGARFVCRYLKNLSAKETAALHAVGLAIVLIYETTANRALGGMAAGTIDGARARSQAAALGAPISAAIYATADFDVTAAQQEAVIAYFAAFGGGGIYGNGAICAAALAANVVKYAWLAGGMGMRGSRLFLASGHATIAQDVGDAAGLNLGIEIDSDTAYADDYGAWLPTEAPPMPVADPMIAATKAWQTAIRGAGFNPGPIDGDYGPRTDAAVQAWRARR